MPKRFGDFNEIKSKKSKIVDNLDDLWDDDPNIEDIDDCLLLATQACEQEVLNGTQLNSTLPHYNLFKHDGDNLFTSTQNNECVENIKQSCSKFVRPYNNFGKNAKTSDESLYINNNPENSVHGLKEVIQTLKEKCESKDGEVSILRTQLKETKINLETEYSKKEKEWIEKVNLASKEINSIKSQLEFKNLELVNLKNNTLEISKANAMNNVLYNTHTFTPLKLHKLNIHTYLTNYKIEPYSDTKCPLIETILPSVFNNKQPELSFTNSKAYMVDNFMKQDECEVALTKHYKLDNILPDIFMLVTSNLWYINSEVSHHHIDRIIGVSYSVLSSFYTYLSIYLKCATQNEVRNGNVFLEQTCRHSYQNLSVFDERAWCEKEVGIKARQTVAIIAEIFPYSIYLQTIFHSYMNDHRNNDLDLKNYLNLLLSTITLIRVTKKVAICEGFLCAVSRLMFRISETKQFDKCYSFIHRIVKEIVAMRPSDIIMKNLILFLKQASVHSDFIKIICKAPQSVSRSANEEEIHFTYDSCLVQVFSRLYRHNFINKEYININNSLSTLQCIINLLKINPSWLHYQENNNCDCLSDISRLGVNVIHECVRNYKKKYIRTANKRNLCQYNEFLKFSVELLHIINSKYYDIINKYSVDSEYKFIVKFLLGTKDDIGLSDFEYETLRELNIQEDVTSMKGILFDGIAIWR